MSDLHNSSLLRSYVVGFGLSLMLTFGAYFSVTKNLFTGNNLIAVIMMLAIVQLIIQLIFFLHLGQESKPRLNRLVFFSMLIVVAIIVTGSIWIMNNLDYHMTPEQTDTYIQEEELIRR